MLLCRGPLGWLVPSEVAPLEVRAVTTAINAVRGSVLAALGGGVDQHTDRASHAADVWYICVPQPAMRFGRHLSGCPASLL